MSRAAKYFHPASDFELLTLTDRVGATINTYPVIIYCNNYTRLEFILSRVLVTKTRVWIGDRFIG
jgi:hypothetical protein